jgi:hypothetical protein
VPFILARVVTGARRLFKQLADSYSYTHARPLTPLQKPAHVCGDEHQTTPPRISYHKLYLSLCGDLIHNGENAPPRQRTISLGKAVLLLLLERHRHKAQAQSTAEAQAHGRMPAYI